MEYAGALGTIIFNESYHLQDLTEAQVGRNQFTIDIAVDRLDERIDEIDRRADHTSEQLSALEEKVMDMGEGYTKLLALGQEQTKTSVQACRAIMVLSTITMVQQDQLVAMRERVVQVEERLDTMREMILVLEHTQENPIVVDEESKGETAVSDGVELEVEENKVAIPIPPPGRLVPIEDVVQELPDKLVGTQIIFDLADEDHLSRTQDIVTKINILLQEICDIKKQNKTNNIFNDHKNHPKDTDEGNVQDNTHSIYNSASIHLPPGKQNTLEHHAPTPNHTLSIDDNASAQ